MPNLIKLMLTSAIIYFAVCTSPQPESAGSPPNILLIISDDQGWTDYGFMGHEVIRTPRLDGLARASLCFTRGYATAPLCSPSLASIITGQYAYRHGITGNDPPFHWEGERYTPEWLTTRRKHFDTLLEDFYQLPLLTEELAGAGYRSLQTGKWWLGSWEDGGFDAGMTHGDPARRGRHGDDGLTIGREGLDTIFNFVRTCQQQDQPFFVWYAPFLPHSPHTPPDSLLAYYLEKVDNEPLARYYAMCEWFDHTCGQLLDFLDAANLTEETLVIYTTDNGWIQDTARMNRYADRSKQSPYELGLRTPLMLRQPGTISPKLDTSTFVSNIDLAPTILARAGVRPEGTLPGLDLTASSQLATRKAIFAEDFAHDIAAVTEPTRSLEHRVIIEKPWKLILPDHRNLPDSDPELYHLIDDPHELKNLAEEHPALVKTLTEVLDDWWKPAHHQE